MDKLTLVCSLLPRGHLISRITGIETLVIFRPVARLCRFASLTLCSNHSDIPSEFIVSKMTYPPNTHVILIFALTPSLKQEDELKEIHYKVEYGNLYNKESIQSMIYVTLTFEDHSTTERVVTTVEGNLYVLVCSLLSRCHLVNRNVYTYTG